MELHVLAQCLKELSKTNGDIEWKAYEAVMRLIECEQEREAIVRYVNDTVKPGLDQAFTTMVDLNSDEAPSQLADLYLNIGIHRTHITELKKLLTERHSHEPRNVEQRRSSTERHKESTQQQSGSSREVG